MGWQYDDHSIGDTRLGCAIGVVTGMMQFFLNINLPLNFWSKFFEAGITAAFCGFCGVAGKYLFNVSFKAMKAYFKRRRNP